MIDIIGLLAKFLPIVVTQCSRSKYSSKFLNFSCGVIRNLDEYFDYFALLVSAEISPAMPMMSWERPSKKKNDDDVFLKTKRIQSLAFACLVSGTRYATDYHNMHGNKKR